LADLVRSEIFSFPPINILDPPEVSVLFDSTRKTLATMPAPISKMAATWMAKTLKSLKPLYDLGPATKLGTLMHEKVTEMVVEMVAEMVADLMTEVVDSEVATIDLVVVDEVQIRPMICTR